MKNWKKCCLIQSTSVFDAIKNQKFFGNRTPLLYIINIYINPFIDNIDLYRTSIFVFSLSGPIIFFLCLKEKFSNTNKSILFLISSLLLLIPFYSLLCLKTVEQFLNSNHSIFFYYC